MTTTSSIGPQYDPATTASALATKFTRAQQDILNARSKQADAVAKGLGDLKSAIADYQSSLAALTTGKTMLSRSATFSDPSFGSASAKSAAAPGTYSFFVKQVATAHQVSYEVTDTPVPKTPPDPALGPLNIKLNGVVPGITVYLNTADANGDKKITPRELAAAINGAADNSGQVSASIVTIGGVSQMLLTARDTGVAGAITVDASGVGDATLAAALVPAKQKEVVKHQQAIVLLGDAASATEISQSSNTFTNIADVSVTFTKAQATGAAPLTVTVATDNSATAANVQAFVDAYNKLRGLLDSVTDAGDPEKDIPSAVFAHDSGVTSLRDRLISMVREREKIGGSSLAGFGIVAAKNGMLTLDATHLAKAVALKPDGLDKLIGSNKLGASSGLAGKLDTYLDAWSGATKGQLMKRQDETTKLQKSLTSRQDMLDKQYDTAYKRYLLQFTTLQTLQTRMASNVSLFDALFGSKQN